MVCSDFESVAERSQIYAGRSHHHRTLQFTRRIYSSPLCKGEKLSQLWDLNTRLDILRHQTRLLLDFQLLSDKRYEYVSQQVNSIGVDLGGWIKQQRQQQLA